MSQLFLLYIGVVIAVAGLFSLGFFYDKIIKNDEDLFHYLIGLFIMSTVWWIILPLVALIAILYGIVYLGKLTRKLFK
jgi:hypothetical protein